MATAGPVGGIITLRTGTNMTHISEAGYTVTIRGTSVTYDEDGFGRGGTIGRVIIAKSGLTCDAVNGAQRL